MDVSVLKRHGLNMVDVAPFVLLVSVIVALLVGYTWTFSITIVLAGIVLGSVMFYCCTRYWVSGNSVYWFLGVVGACVMPAIILKSFYAVSFLVSIEFVAASLLVLLNKKRLVSALAQIT